VSDSVAPAHLGALDASVAVETPEGISLVVRPAGLMVRGLAFVIDWLLRLVFFFALAAFLSRFKGMGTGLTLMSYFALSWLYPVIMEWLPGSATLGKRAMGLKVVMDNGLPLTLPASLTRNLLRVVDLMPAFYLAGALSTLARSDFKRLGDVLAGTLVVHTSQPRPFAGWPEARALAPCLPLNQRQQSAVLGLAARSGRLTPERLDELARLAAKHLPATEPNEGAGRRLLSVAQWLVRRPETQP
jgi:uncharacterized RDD family membrane protein YckC